jgi:hypothetical protein
MRNRISVTSAPNAAEGSRENRQRVDVAFVQDAQHDVDHHDGIRSRTERLLSELSNAFAAPWN